MRLQPAHHEVDSITLRNHAGFVPAPALPSPTMTSPMLGLPSPNVPNVEPNGEVGVSPVAQDHGAFVSD